MTPTISDFDARPRSWSAQDADYIHYLRPQPSNLSAKGAHTLRRSTSVGLGRFVSQPSSPSIAPARAPSVRARTFTGRPGTPVVGEQAALPRPRHIRRHRNAKTLEMMRPLVAPMEEECSEATTARSVSAGSSKSLESSISRASGVSKGSDGSVGRPAKPVVSA
ncbi:hypothetical protein EC988_010128, partial [Linderina pennispora]